ncbi:MAG TPA: prepilin-type N-terminal cleavage/methylation domain-containing protein [Desulfotomaculum sp.]|nr:prepilin-type N-terminal cleavage/methylation domain-containing protein [Desulfotomaculum sp.]
MYYRFCRLLKSQKGFTLVELMVVLIIIAILVAIAIPLYAGTQNNARNRACDANIRTINGAIAQYYAEFSEYPDSIDDLVDAHFLKDYPDCPWDGVGDNDADGYTADYSIDTNEDPPVAQCDVDHS